MPESVAYYYCHKSKLIVNKIAINSNTQKTEELLGIRVVNIVGWLGS